jgi:cytochrome P450
LFSFAGSDTTAIPPRSIFYYLCKNQRCYNKLVAEIDEMDKKGELSSPITFAEASRMSFLQACMKEAMRIHPAVGQMLERVVPAGGAQFGGEWLPPGTIVGINPWIVGREKSVYGDDADEFRPERWLDADTESSKAMQRNFLAVSLLL